MRCYATSMTAVGLLISLLVQNAVIMKDRITVLWFGMAVWDVKGVRQVSTLTNFRGTRRWLRVREHQYIFLNLATPTLACTFNMRLS